MSRLENTSQYNAIVLGAGKNIRCGPPAAMENVHGPARVLDWQIDAFSVLPSVEMHFVSGYQAATIEENYKNIRFRKSLGLDLG